MTSQVLADGTVVPPLNINNPAPAFNVQGFRFAPLEDRTPGPFPGLSSRLGGPPGRFGRPGPPGGPGGPGQKPVPEQPEEETGETQLDDQLHHPGGPATQPAPLLDFPLTQLSGAYTGNGFSLIWVPRKFEGAPGPKNDNILILQLTTEQWTFGPTLGHIPNRGFQTQEVINLGGLAYMQTVQNVTNDETGKGDKPKTTAGSGIHFEPGMFLYVPKANFQTTDTIVRMASIPHGTTINAQGPVPAKNPAGTLIGGDTGAPKIDVVDTTPFFINNPSSRDQLAGAFADPMTAETISNTLLRVPQNLKDKFVKNETITTAIIKDPNTVLRNALKGMTVKEHVAFELSTGGATAKVNSGGISNIAFLSGKQDPVPDAVNPARVNAPNAHAESATSKFWIEKIEYDVIVPKMPGSAAIDLKPEMPPSPHQAPTPRFRITAPPGGVPSGGKRIKVIGTQIQYTQNITLNFGGLSWPHVTCATLVPTDPQLFQMTGRE
ncbi:hypothetical protein QBC39DRAFT_337421 [Podospora conica]|nr:hypothetical protein QBC39DRAFT_337421 [Schizothecium conicum]